MKVEDFLGRQLLNERLVDEPIAGQPLVEWIGNHRVLIENHRGIKAFSICEVIVGVKCGCYKVIGQNLGVAQMSKHSLVITGSIEAVQYYGGRIG